MFGRNPRFPQSTILGGEAPRRKWANADSYIRDHQKSLRVARHLALKKSNEAAAARKAVRAQQVFEKPIDVGQYVLVRRRGQQGRCKIQDYWEEEPYMVLRRPYQDGPVYVVRNSLGKEKVLHRQDIKHCPFLVGGQQESTDLPSDESVGSSPDDDPPRVYLLCCLDIFGCANPPQTRGLRTDEVTDRVDRAPRYPVRSTRGKPPS